MCTAIIIAVVCFIGFFGFCINKSGSDKPLNYPNKPTIEEHEYETYFKNLN